MNNTPTEGLRVLRRVEPRQSLLRGGMYVTASETDVRLTWARELLRLANEYQADAIAENTGPFIEGND